MRKYLSSIKVFQSAQKGVTLIELIIAITLLLLVLAAAMSIDMAGQWFFKSTSVQAEIQDELQPAIEHMVKNTQLAFEISLDPIAGDTAIRIYVDLAADGQSPGDGRRDTEGDCWRAYRHRMTGQPNERYQIWYYPNYVNPASQHEMIAKGIVDTDDSGNLYDLFSLSDNDIFLTITIRGERVIQETPEIKESATLISGVTLRCRMATL